MVEGGLGGIDILSASLVFPVKKLVAALGRQCDCAGWASPAGVEVKRHDA